MTAVGSHDEKLAPILREGSMFAPEGMMGNIGAIRPTTEDFESRHPSCSGSRNGTHVWPANPINRQAEDEVLAEHVPGILR